MISFKLFAGTNIGLRDNNEDNFTVCPDLTLDEWRIPANHQQTIPLGKRGCVVVVADGMGGQNAGEVASDIAIKTVEEMFAPSTLPVDVSEKSGVIEAYLKKVIEEADLRVKQHSKDYPETLGMGSTIIIVWLLGENVYVAWLGDSRAYSYVPGKGIGRLSKDHSYVQQLVDAKVLTEEQAMNDPNSNVITRSLGDPSQKAKADVASYAVEQGEVILLCSDGLCGVCNDEEIGGIIEAESADLQVCKEKLTTAALTNGGSDNITIVLLQIEKTAPSDEEPQPPQKQQSLDIWRMLLYPFVAVILLCMVYSWNRLYHRVLKKENPPDVEQVDCNVPASLSEHTPDTVAEDSVLINNARSIIKLITNGGTLSSEKTTVTDTMTEESKFGKLNPADPLNDTINRVKSN